MAKRNKIKIDEDAKFDKGQFNRSLKIFSYMLPYKWSFIIGMVLLFLGSGIFLAIMKVPGEIFNIIDGQSKYDISVNQLFIALVILLGLQSLLSFLRVQLFAIVSEKSTASLRRELYEKLITLDIPFFEKNRVGELTSRISNDVAQVHNVLSITLAEFFRQIIILVGGIGLIIYTMPRLALIMLFTFPVVVIAAMFFGRYIRDLMKARQDELAQTNVVVEETIQNIQDVKTYTNEKYEVNRYVERLNNAVRVALKAATMRGLFSSFIILVMFGALFFIMWRAAIMVQNGDMYSGDLVDFVVYTGLIGAAIASLGSFYTQLVSAIGASDRLLDIMQEDSEINLTAAPQDDVRFSGALSFNSVSFHYPTRPDIEVLKNISFSVQPGERIALVGASGAGKSTIMQLLLQFYHTSNGNISIDGKDITDYALSDYRRNFGLVPQEVLLFGGTIKENIAYGNPDATEEQIIEAAKQANAWNFISSFPEGLETLVGERGVKLSGGQRQRVAIARAILKNPAILLLDEATSALDAESEKAVQEALDNLMENRTSIVIAHRLSTIRNVDCIYVIEDGKIIEKGTHNELAAIEGGAYNTLAKLQFEIQ